MISPFFTPCRKYCNLMQFIGFMAYKFFTVKPRFYLAAWILALLPVCGMATQSHAGNLTFGRPIKTIVLDPGHGGHDPGAKGPEGTLEKNVTLGLARMIVDICRDSYRVVLTRTGDYGLDIPDRTAAANHAGADLFISIHTGASFRHQAEGLNLYYYAETDRSSQTVPLQVTEPFEDSNGPTPWDQIQTRHRTASQDLAFQVHRHLVERLHPAADKIQGLPILVLQGADMPAIMVEVGYISNPSGEEALKDPEFLTAAAEAICQGIGDFLKRSHP